MDFGYEKLITGYEKRIFGYGRVFWIWPYLFGYGRNFGARRNYPLTLAILPR